MSFWADKRVLVTGGRGFVGSHVVEALEGRGCQQVFAPGSSEYDLVDRDQAAAMIRDTQPDLVLHLAATVGGIGANRNEPARFFYENLIIGVELLHQAWLQKVPKFVAVGTVCAYPNLTPVPFREEALWNGYPEPTNAPYGLAKKMLLVQSQAYRQQYGYNSIFLLPTNIYGPRDHFDLETSHVIPALIRKCIDALEEGRDRIELWGDGSPTREFLYVTDAAEGILLAAEHYNRSDPVNLGSGFEISIRDLVTLIARETGFQGRIEWNASKPNGQPRRLLDSSRAEAGFGFRAKVEFPEGLSHTVAWYREALRKGARAPA